MEINADLNPELTSTEPEGAGDPEALSATDRHGDAVQPPQRELEAVRPVDDPTPKPRTPRLEVMPLLPIRDGDRISQTETAKPKFRYSAAGLAAGVALLALAAAGASYQRSGPAATLTAQVSGADRLSQSVANLGARLDAIEATRSHDESGDLRKSMGEIRAAATREVALATTQLNARVDRVERDQGARVDKLGERVDHDSSARFADFATRIDKLEKKAATPVVATAASPTPDRVERDLGARLDKLGERVDHDTSARFADLATRIDKLEKKVAAPVVAAAASPTPDRVERDLGARLDKLGERVDHDTSARFADLVARIDKLEKKSTAPAIAVAAPMPPKQPPLGAKAEVGVSNEPTGAIEKAKPALRGYAVVDVTDGFATIEGREGTVSVSAGETIPGLGRVLRIERHGRDWSVVTSMGVIGGQPSLY